MARTGLIDERTAPGVYAGAVLIAGPDTTGDQVSQPAARLTDDERRILTDFCRHMRGCRKCTNRDGTTATFRGCMAGHLTAVRSATILARFFPPPAPPDPAGQGAMF